jgi:NADH-quinone oxidoreductase subunit M
MGILSLLTFFPLAGVLILLLMRNQSDNSYKIVAVGTSIVTFVLSLIVLGQYDGGLAGLQLVDNRPWIEAWGIEYHMGVDGISILMVLLTTFIMMLAIPSSWNAISTQVRQYYIFMLLLEVGMMGVFLAQDLFLFYIFWEFTLVPMYFLIGIWGGKNRVYAAIKFFLYTMAGSLLMLLGILYMGITNGHVLFAGLDCQPVPFCRCNAGSSWVLPSPLPSKCRFSRSTPGCPTRTPKHRRPVPSFWRVCC